MGMPQRQFLRHETAQRVTDNMGRLRIDCFEPIRDVVGHFGRGVRVSEPVAAADVAGVKSKCPKPLSEVALGQPEDTMVATQAAQKHKWLPLLTRLRVMERMTVHKNTWHVARTRSSPRTLLHHGTASSSD